MNKEILSAKDIFDKKIALLITEKSSKKLIELFSQTSFDYFYNLQEVKGLKERQIASIIGFKDEYFVETIINLIIKENKLTNKFYCKKVTANKTSGIKGRSIKINNKIIDLTFGGDCVIFYKRKDVDIPILIIECKEYIDMIRMKELIGESKIIRDKISNSITNFPNIKFWVFAEVLELTDGWSYLFNNSNLKHNIDKIFIVRKGKRKDKNNKPQQSELVKFRDEIKRFLINYK